MHCPSRTLAAVAGATAVAVLTAFRTPGRPAAGENPPTDYTLRLGGASFDPLLEEIPLPAGWAAVPAPGAALRLVQFTGPTRGPWLDELAARDIEIVQYVHPYTYIVWSDAASLDAARDVNAVRWAGQFHPAYRVLPQWRHLPDEPLEVNALLYRGADTDAIVRAVMDLGGRSTGRLTLNRTFEVAGFAVSGALLRQMAQIPGVYSVQPRPTDGGLRSEMSDQVCAGNYGGDHMAYPGYLDWLAGVGLDGSGVIIANVDGGVQDSHPDLAARMVPCSGDTCGGGASSGHGTHTAGIMAADGSSDVLDAYGFLRGLGVAPGAQLVEQLYSPWYQYTGGMLLLMRESFANGALLSGNSWGPAGSPLGYDNDTMQVDIGSRDTDPDTPGDQPLLYVLSIMNGGGGTSTQGTPDEAKNIFTIGSTWMQYSGGAQRADINDVSANSAHGPCLDGRTIPHLVAPGCEVDSSYSGGGYALLCGTSMASPHVSGAAALFIEAYRNRPDFTVDPSPALVKAAFLPVAHDLAGNHDADGGLLGHPFDNKQGWGRMDVAAVVAPQPGSVRYFDNPVVFDDTGQEWSVVLSPLDPAQPMKIMLAWTDAPGHGLGGSTPAWNNDLDLVVEAGGTYYGNNFGPDGWSVTGGAADYRNNTEGVFLGPVPPGAVTVRVVAANITSDGLPNSGDVTDQDFALVAYNAAEEPGFAVSADPAAQAVCAPDEASWQIEITQILDYSEPVTLAAAGAPPGTTVAFADNPVVPPAATTMTVSDTDAAAWGDYTIDVTGTSVDMTRGTSVGLALSTALPAAPDLLSPPDGAVEVPVLPTLQWSVAEQASSYDLAVATDPGFAEVVYAATTADTVHTLEQPLDAMTSYYWRVVGANACGDGAASAASSFTSQDVPAVLLVDDDDDSPDARAYYSDALESLGVWHDVWDTGGTDAEPAVGDLAPYQVVIWFTGDSFGGTCGPGSAGEAALAAWLDDGGCLLIASQDYHYDRGLTSFMSGYLGVASVTDDVGQVSVTGTGPAFEGLGPYALSYPFSNWSDRVTARAGAGALAFSGDAGDAGVVHENPAYRAAYLGFPLAAVAAVDDRADVLAAMLGWCGGLTPDCPADLDGDGTVGVTDFLELLASWGPNAGHPADLDGDGAVGVTDMLELLAQWGPCA